MADPFIPVEIPVSGPDPVAEVFRFDQRRSPRHPATGRVTLLRRDHDVQAYLQPYVGMDLRNLSGNGLAAVSRMPLAIDEQVSVYFPPHGSEGGLEMQGHVVRCRPIGHTEMADGTTRPSYEVAVAFDIAAAA